MENKNLLNTLEVGKKGVTNKQLIPIIKEAVDQGDQFTLKTLTLAFSEAFASSLKYIGKARFNKIGGLL